MFSLFKMNIVSVFVGVSIFIMGLNTLPSTAQTPRKRLPTGINIPTTSQVYPSVTADGMYMVFMSNYTNSGFFELMYSNKIGADNWERGEPLHAINKTDLDHLGSFTVSYDGQYLFFSSQRAKGIGRFDIWYCERRGNGWSAPINMGKPVNSPGHEGNPSLSPDGRTLYFMRCESMDRTSKDNCTIYMAQKESSTRWGTPVPLPSSINTGNETTPRIMIDNQTLLFASDRPGGKGGMDLYQTRMESGRWSKPVALDFINSEKNDEFVSVPASGDVLYYHDKYNEHFQLFKALIPEALRPNPVVLMTGTVRFANAPPMDALVQAIDVQSNETVASTRINSGDGSFFMALPAGSRYDFSVFPMQPGFAYHAEIIDLDSLDKSAWEKPAYTINRLQRGDGFVLEALHFDAESHGFTPESSVGLRRLLQFMKQNSGHHFEVVAYIDTLRTDSIPSIGLPEVRADTSLVVIDKRVLKAAVEEQTDSTALDQLNDYLTQGYLKMEEDRKQLTLGKINYTYHNDQTPLMAEAVVKYLVDKGAPAEMFVAKGAGDRWSRNHASVQKNHWIEIRMID